MAVTAAINPANSSRATYAGGSSGTPTSRPITCPRGTCATTAAAARPPDPGTSSGDTTPGAATSVTTRRSSSLSRQSRWSTRPPLEQIERTSPGSCSHCTRSSWGSWRHKQSPTSTGAKHTPRSIRAGNSYSVMNLEARKSLLTNINATRTRAIAASIPSRHTSPTCKRWTSIHNSNRRARINEVSITWNRWAHTASAWL